MCRASTVPYLTQCVHAFLVVSDSFATPWTVAYQATLSMEFSSQE